MKVKDVMMRTAARCHPDTNLGAAVEMMWTRNCGILPVVDAEDKLVGVITDRDICIALGTRNLLAGDVAVKDVASAHVYWCKSDDDVRSALQVMAASKIRRLPVVSSTGVLEGILSMDDVVLHTEAGGQPCELPAEKVVKTLQSVYSSGLPQLAEKKFAVA
jgi:CBS domain-containing protein